MWVDTVLEGREDESRCVLTSGPNHLRQHEPSRGPDDLGYGLQHKSLSLTFTMNGIQGTTACHHIHHLPCRTNDQHKSDAVQVVDSARIPFEKTPAPATTPCKIWNPGEAIACKMFIAPATCLEPRHLATLYPRLLSCHQHRSQAVDLCSRPQNLGDSQLPCNTAQKRFTALHRHPQDNRRHRNISDEKKTTQHNTTQKEN